MFTYDLLCKTGLIIQTTVSFKHSKFLRRAILITLPGYQKFVFKPNHNYEYILKKAHFDLIEVDSVW